MENQLQIMLLENLYNQKQLSSHSVNGGRRTIETVQDILWWVCIPKALQQRFVNNKDNVSITFNIDGAPVFKSSKGSIWPIQFICNKLPPEVRVQPNNVMLAGLWFGKKHP